MTMTAEQDHQLRTQDPVESVVNSYSPERQDERETAVLSCGIEQDRLALYMLGYVALSCDEQELLDQARYRL